MPVLNPFPHIAVHVVQPPRVGPLCSHRMRVFFARIPGVVVEPRVFLQAAFTTCKRPPGRSSCATGVLPFRFGRQTIQRITFRFVQSVDELLHLVPGDKDGRMVGIRLHVDLPFPWTGAHHRFPLTLGYLLLAQIEPPADPHLVLRSFIRIPPLFRIRRSHRKHPRLDPHHFHRGSTRKIHRDLSVLCENVGRCNRAEKQKTPEYAARH